MNSIRLGATFDFPADALSEVELLTHKNALYFKSFGGAKYGFGDPVDVSLFKEEDGVVSVPRRYAHERLPMMFHHGLDELVDGSDVKFRFDEKKQASRPDMKERQDETIDEFMGVVKSQKTPMKGGIFCAPCGTGKTVAAAKLMSLFGKTTLVLVHKEFLMEQWVARLVEFLNVKKKDIGFVQQKKCDFQGKKVVIAMIQSLMEGDKYPPEFFDWPGVIIADECHRMSAPCFQSVIPKFPARVRIGLSATPRRADGLQPVFEWHIGKVIAKMEGGTGVVPKVYQVPFDIWFPEESYIWRDKKTNAIKKMFLAKLINLLVAVPARNKWLVREMFRAAKAGRRVMLLSDRREHLKDLKRIIDAQDVPFTCGFYIGGMKKKDREKSLLCDIILATFQMSKEGLDIPEIDTLYLTTPKSDIEQPTGRILRFHKDKKEAIIVDVVDSLQTCVDFAVKRFNQYERLGFDVVRSVFDK